MHNPMGQLERGNDLGPPPTSRSAPRMKRLPMLPWWPAFVVDESKIEEIRKFDLGRIEKDLPEA